MKTPLLLVMVLVLALFGSIALIYQSAARQAAEWKMMDPSFQDQNPPDLDGLTDIQAREITHEVESGSNNLRRWPITGGMLSLAVLDYRFRQVQWTRAYALSGRIAEGVPGSRAANLAGRIHREMTVALILGGVTLATMLGLGLVWRRTQGET